MTSLISPKHPVEEIVSPRPRERRNGEKAEGEYSTKVQKLIKEMEMIRINI